jgi:hypothetical protein
MKLEFRFCDFSQNDVGVWIASFLAMTREVCTRDDGVWIASFLAMTGISLAMTREVSRNDGEVTSVVSRRATRSSTDGMLDCFASLAMTGTSLAMTGISLAMTGTSLAMTGRSLAMTGN